MKNFIQPGKTLDLVAPSGGVTSGVGFKVGAIIAIAATTQVAGATVSGDTEGVFEVSAATSQAWTQGAVVYWDDTAKNFTTTSSSNTKAGYAAAAKDSAAAVGWVRLVPSI